MNIEAMARETGLTPLGFDDSIYCTEETILCSMDDIARFAALARAEALEEAAVICDKRAQHFAGLIEQQSCAQCLAFDIRAAKEKP